ncbi:MAG: ribonuclease III [Chthonomonadaceae bacterium]|nr:ribonuclease III [Chthonomonadaceae bacterium]
MENKEVEALRKSLRLPLPTTENFAHALTHRSVTTDNSLQSNERLEFLGDAIVGLVIGQMLYTRYPELSEGGLAKSKAYLVSENALAAAALSIHLDASLTLSAGEETSGGRKRRSILSDAFEAMIAAIYLDHGLEEARRVILHCLEPAILSVSTDRHRGDYKSALQEATQRLHRRAPLYKIIEEIGGDHEKVFVCEALLERETTEVLGQGRGRNKKEAEQSAAQDALSRIEQNETKEPVSDL